MGVKVGSGWVSSDVQKAGGRALGCLGVRVTTQCVVRLTQDMKGCQLGLYRWVLFCFLQTEADRKE